MAGNLTGARAAAWVRRGLPVLAPPSVAMEAVEAAATIGRAWSAPLPVAVGRQHGHLHVVSRREGGLADTGRVLDEAEGKAYLRRHGIPVPDGEACTSATGAVRAAARVGGPVLRGPRQVGAAATELLARFPAVLVERMVTGGVVELLVGVEPDPALGLVLTLGAGGVLTELLRDVAHVLLPAGPAEIRSALLGLRCAPLLTGYRGARGTDLDALVVTVARVVDVAAETVSVEINPLIVTEDGAWACDVLITEGAG
jgi:acyl-CoA synthetase (NDP forming)